MATAEGSHLRLIRDPDPLASYIRPLGRDLGHTADLIAAGFPVGDGIIIDACAPQRSDGLRRAAREADLAVILDPRSVELSTPGGRRRSGVTELPWATKDMDEPGRFGEGRCREFAEALVNAAVELDVTAILAPSHYHDAFPSSWFEVDVRLTRALHGALDEAGVRARIHIYFPLISKLSALLPALERRRTLARLAGMAEENVIDALWLRMHGFGSTQAGPFNLKRYIELARDAHGIGVPVVAERTGTVGIAFLAFGAAAGIESSITHGEWYDVRPLMKPRSRSGGGFTIQPRVYLPQIGAFLKREPAAAFLNSRNIKNGFACQESCCKRGIVDMLAEPRRHFLVNRTREVENLARVPQEARVEHYFDTWLRLASDRATRAARVEDSLMRQRDRLDQWRATLSEIRDRDGQSRASISPSIGTLTPPPHGEFSSDRLSLF